MQVVVIARTLEAQLRQGLADSTLAASAVTALDRVTARQALVERPPDLLIVECEGAGALELIKELRAATVTLPLIAIAEGVTFEDAVEAGADEVLAPWEIDGRAIARATRHAFVNRENQRAGLQLLESMQRFGEALAVEEELDEVVNQVLDQIVASTSAEIGLLVCDLEWRGISDRVVALRGAELSEEDLEALPLETALSPLRSAPEIRGLEPGELDERFEALGPIASVMTVPLARSAAWGQGGVALASSRVNAFSEQDLQVATALAAWAGVALLHSGALRERDRAIEIRERILAVASHDLRTPLSVLNMVIELLGESESADERTSLVARAERAVNTMHRLIGDLLDYAAVDAGKLRIELAPARAPAIARRSVEALAPEAEAAGVALTCEIEDGDLDVVVDAGRIEQALNNIIGNAIKFTPKGGEVELRVSAGENTVRFAVTDTGPGIPEEHQRRLFDRYTTSSKAGKGVGLGLSIARGIVAHHGGTVLVESTPGEGATFLISLPRRTRPDES